MIKLLRALWHALLPLIAVIVIITVMHGIVCGFKFLGLGEVSSILLSSVVLIYVFLVVVFYGK
jgi:hypothetical protein